MKPANIAVNTSNPRLEKQGRKRVSNAPRVSGMLTLRGIGGTLLHWWCCMHHQCSAQFHQTPGRRAEETAKNSNSQRHRFTRWTRWTARGMESPDQSHRHEAASNCESRAWITAAQFESCRSKR